MRTGWALLCFAYLPYPLIMTPNWAVSMKAAAPLLYLREEELTDGVELFFFAGRSVADAVDARLGELGLGHADYRAMHFVARHPGMPVSDLLSILGITKQSLSRVVRALTQGGYLVQTTGVSDRRQRLLRLTPKGMAVEARKVLASAIANAENNHNLDVDALVVTEASVGKGIVMKRFATRGRGKSTRILKPFSRLRIVVREMEEEA